MKSSVPSLDVPRFVINISNDLSRLNIVLSDLNDIYEPHIRDTIQTNLIRSFSGLAIGNSQNQNI